MAQTLSVFVCQMHLLRCYQLIWSSELSVTNKKLWNIYPIPNFLGTLPSLCVLRSSEGEGCEWHLNATEATLKSPSRDWALSVKAFGR